MYQGLALGRALLILARPALGWSGLALAGSPGLSSTLFLINQQTTLGLLS